jgi:2-polyprenyl-3-methyl-5-hydroxy-6-metoxy-1,4-benzoquinol methylase
MNHPDYLAKNKAAWNARTQFHFDSSFYDVPAFMAGATSLRDPELALLGDVKGLDILHLQCHFGQDSLSLARMGAHVTGVDLSDMAIEKARALNAALNLDAAFICCDLYALPEHTQQKFDIVFTSYGTIGWLPDLDKWAKIIQQHLKPGGKLVFVEFHPFVWMFDNDFTYIQYPYFNTQPIVEINEGTYADREAPIRYEEISWNHSIDEVLSSLLQNGMTLTSFKEYDFSPYNCFRNMKQLSEQQYIIPSLGRKIPLLYSLTATKQ